MNCEEVLIQKLAFMDGEKTDVSDQQLTEHLTGCEICRREFAELEKTTVMLRSQKRRHPEADLWPGIETRIGAKKETSASAKWPLFALLGSALVIYKLLELVPARDFGWTFKFIPFVFALALFGLLKENPFKIKTELILEK